MWRTVGTVAAGTPTSSISAMAVTAVALAIRHGMAGRATPSRRAHVGFSQLKAQSAFLPRAGGSGSKAVVRPGNFAASKVQPNCPQGGALLPIGAAADAEQRNALMRTQHHWFRRPAFSHWVATPSMNAGSSAPVSALLVWGQAGTQDFVTAALFALIYVTTQ
jgi:hypothetical protein